MTPLIIARRWFLRPVAHCSDGCLLVRVEPAGR